MTTHPEDDILVIGAGVIGITAALALARDGHRVRVLDREGIAAGASQGNAGAFALADIEPLATPGILAKAPKWLLDPLGPLSIRPAYAARLLPWMVRFWRASRPKHHAAAIAAQAGLMDVSHSAIERLIAQTDGAPLIRREGQMQLYEGRTAFDAAQPAWDTRRAHGIAFDLLDDPGAIAEIQPGLSPRFTHAGFTPNWMNTTDPKRWTEHLAACLTAAGGHIERADIQRLIPQSDGVEVTTSAGPRRARQVVVAAGAWSHRLAATIGDRIPLDTERGYNTTFPTASFDLRTHLTFGAHGFVITRIGDGLRVGGAVELGGLDLPPNFRRAEILVQKAAAFLPGFDPSGGWQWMGFRPSLPDSLPVIGRAPKAQRVIYAFGHGHLGLTQSAGTAELIAALVAGRPPQIDLAPFAPERFHR